MRFLAISILWASSIAASAALPGLAPLNTIEPSSFTLTCEIENSNTTEPSHIGIVKVTAQNIGNGPVIHWKAPSVSWVTLVLRPVDEQTWASRVELGSEEGTHQLQCMIVGVAGGGEIMARTYRLITPTMMLTETGVPEIWSQEKARHETTSPAIVTPEIVGRAPDESKGRFSSVLAGVIVFSINLVFLFGVGVGFVVHRRRKSHHDLVTMHEVHQKFVDAGLMESSLKPIEPVVPVEEPPKIDVPEAVAAVAVVESMNSTIDEAAKQDSANGVAEEENDAEPKAETPEEGVDIRKASEEEEEKVDLHDLSF